MEGNTAVVLSMHDKEAGRNGREIENKLKNQIKEAESAEQARKAHAAALAKMGVAIAKNGGGVGGSARVDDDEDEDEDEDEEDDKDTRGGSDIVPMADKPVRTKVSSSSSLSPVTQHNYHTETGSAHERPVATYQQAPM